jgi:hypothetical protein
VGTNYYVEATAPCTCCGRPFPANGLKLYPAQAEKLVGSDPRLWWIRDYHQKK